MTQDTPNGILLFNMPWVEPSHAPLGLGIVKSLLTRIGLPVEVRHPNLDFHLELVDLHGMEAARHAYAQGEMGEVMAGLLYRRGRNPVSERELGPGQSNLIGLLQRHDYPVDLFRATLNAFDRFSRRAVAALPLEDVAACGFTLCIRQTMASLLWARLIKQRAPDVQIVFGGSTCEDPMGLALMRGNPVVDWLVRGEADTSIQPLFQAIVSGDESALDEIPNIAFRRNGEVVATSRVIVSMDSAVAPDHREFELAYRPLWESTGVPANYYIEASRGCWWGQKSHCTFCGIHTSAIQFRQKSVATVMAEIEELLEKRQTFRFVFADTILALDHLKELLPRLEELNRRCGIEFLLDVKSNLKKEQVYLLARAGCVALQPGIESLSDRLLSLMRKGNTALQQIRALKWFKEVGIFPFYAILTHVAGERPEDYHETLGFARNLVHLTPPSAVTPIEINRYAPYYRQWRELGFEKPRPAAYYSFMFGPGVVDLEDFAYHFEGVHPSTKSDELKEARAALRQFVDERWRRQHRGEALSYRVGRGFIQIRRTGGRDERRILEGPEAELYLRCDDIRHWKVLAKEFRGRIPESRLRRVLEEWREDGLMVRSLHHDRYLALATHALARKPRLSDHPRSSAVSAPLEAESALGAA